MVLKSIALVPGNIEDFLKNHHLEFVDDSSNGSFQIQKRDSRSSSTCFGEYVSCLVAKAWLSTNPKYIIESVQAYQIVHELKMGLDSSDITAIEIRDHNVEIAMQWAQIDKVENNSTYNANIGYAHVFELHKHGKVTPDVVQSSVLYLRSSLESTDDDEVKMSLLIGICCAHLYVDPTASIEAARSALALGCGGINVERCTFYLAWALLIRYESSGFAADLDEGIKFARDAIAVVSGHLPADIAIYHSTLAIALTRRFELRGNMTDLDESIQIMRDIIDECQPSEKPGSCDTLMISLVRRFEQTGYIADLNEAIELGRDLMASGKMSIINHLPVTLLKRAEQTGNIRDFDESIQMLKEMVESTTLNQDELFGVFNDLAVVLFNRFKYTGSKVDLEESIVVARKSVAMIPPSHRTFSIISNSLGVALFNKFNVTGERDALDEFIDIERKALNAVTEDHLGFSM